MSTDTLALLLSFLIISLFGFGGLAALIILVSRDTTKTPEVVNRVSNIEKLVERLAADVTAERSSPMTEVWRTADGKYEANSFEELLTKMAQDPETPLSSDEIESIKSIFEKIMGQHDDDEPTGWKDSV
jgi:hypothetical protein